MSQWVITKHLRQKFPYFAKARSGLGNYWQVSVFPLENTNNLLDLTLCMMHVVDCMQLK